MYSESDLQAAVEAGAISAEAANALRGHVAAANATPIVDEEHFRLLTGFNDIFVSIAGVILLVAVGWLGNMVKVGGGAYDPSPLAGFAVAAFAWGLAEYFTRVRRMALPSIFFLLAFSGGVFFGLFALGAQLFSNANEGIEALVIAVISLITAAATWAHWRRFMVPITVAVGAAALSGVALSFAAWQQMGRTEGTILYVTVLVLGLAIFAFAMWWDSSDRARTTRRSDVAFWLHLTAAPMIAHSLFQLLGVFSLEGMGAGQAVAVVLLYVGFGLLALAIDRRALLVSSLAYVLYAMYVLLQQTQAAFETSAALTALVIGSALLLLSAFWQGARRWVVTMLPGAVQTRLPYVDRVLATAA